MANITCLSSLAETFFVEFENKLYLRVEIMAREPGQAIESMQFGAEVYQLAWTNGASPTGKTTHSKTIERQSWAYLEDFPMICGNSAAAVRKEALSKLAAYAESCLKKQVAEVRRSRPAH